MPPDPVRLPLLPADPSLHDADLPYHSHRRQHSAYQPPHAEIRPHLYPLARLPQFWYQRAALLSPMAASYRLFGRGIMSETRYIQGGWWRRSHDGGEDNWWAWMAE